MDSENSSINLVVVNDVLMCWEMQDTIWNLYPVPGVYVFFYRGQPLTISLIKRRKVNTQKNASFLEVVTSFFFHSECCILNIINIILCGVVLMFPFSLYVLSHPIHIITNEIENFCKKKLEMCQTNFKNVKIIYHLPKTNRFVWQRWNFYIYF